VEFVVGGLDDPHAATSAPQVAPQISLSAKGLDTRRLYRAPGNHDVTVLCRGYPSETIGIREGLLRHPASSTARANAPAMRRVVRTGPLVRPTYALCAQLRPAVVDGFDVVAVGVQHKRAVIVL
jgi:hypothetical protein